MQPFFADVGELTLFWQNDEQGYPFEAFIRYHVFYCFRQKKKYTTFSTRNDSLQISKQDTHCKQYELLHLRLWKRG